jgi:hypothetical protein
MSYRIGDDFYQMEEGDSLTFNAEISHGPQTLTTSFVRFLTVMMTPE